MRHVAEGGGRGKSALVRNAGPYVVVIGNQPPALPTSGERGFNSGGPWGTEVQPQGAVDTLGAKEQLPLVGAQPPSCVGRLDIGGGGEAESLSDRTQGGLKTWGRSGAP